MARNDSIHKKGLETHINEHCFNKKLPWRYSNFADWVDRGDGFGEPVTSEWLRRRFGVSRPTIEKWLTIYKEEKNVQTS